MPSATYALFRAAILAERQVVCSYDGRLRELCPHIIGRNRSGEEVVLPIPELPVRVNVKDFGALGDGQDPQDVEWAHDGERFWLLQGRPVTRPERHFGAAAAA